MGAAEGRSRTPLLLVSGVVVSLALASLALPSSATYDPWSWILWGREIIHADLDTTGGPSWKPLPMVVTPLAALLGSTVAPYVWIVVARIGALAGIVLAWRLGRRLGGAVAAFVAAVPLALAPWWVRNGWLANSEGLLVAVVLGAFAAELAGRRRLALACGIAAGLLRPEAWPFLLLYAGWLALRAGRRGRAAIAASLLVLPVAWFVPEKLGSGDFWRAASRAQDPDPGAASFAEHPALTIVGHTAHMLPTAMWIALGVGTIGLLATALERRRRPRADAVGPDDLRRCHEDRVAVAVALVGLGWLAVVAVLTIRGFSGNQRYLMPPAALLLLAAAVALGRVWPRVPGPLRAGLAVALVVVTVVPAVRYLPETGRRVGYESRLVHELPVAIRRAGGGAHLLACGPVYTNRFYVPQAAWVLRVPAERVGFKPAGRRMVLLRVRTGKSDPIRPVRPDVRGLVTLARTKSWEVQSTCGPPATGAPTR